MFLVVMEDPKTAALIDADQVFLLDSGAQYLYVILANLKKLWPYLCICDSSLTFFICQPRHLLIFAIILMQNN